MSTTMSRFLCRWLHVSNSSVNKARFDINSSCQLHCDAVSKSQTNSNFTHVPYSQSILLCGINSMGKHHRWYHFDFVYLLLLSLSFKYFMNRCDGCGLLCTPNRIRWNIPWTFALHLLDQQKIQSRKNANLKVKAKTKHCRLIHRNRERE
jgi:hypothetical protein